VPVHFLVTVLVTFPIRVSPDARDGDAAAGIHYYES